MLVVQYINTVVYVNKENCSICSICRKHNLSEEDQSVVLIESPVVLYEESMTKKCVQ